MTFVWTEEAVERLKALHAEGLSGAELAARLGCGLSRSAIFGKLHRLGLTGKRGPATQVQRSRLVARELAGFAEHAIAASGTIANRFAVNVSAATGSAASRFSGLPRFNFARKARSVPRAPAAVPVPAGKLPPPSLRIGITEIGANQCSFIAGDDGLACGHETVGGSSWCPAHRAIVFAPEEA